MGWVFRKVHVSGLPPFPPYCWAGIALSPSLGPEPSLLLGAHLPRLPHLEPPGPGPPPRHPAGPGPSLCLGAWQGLCPVPLPVPKAQAVRGRLWELVPQPGAGVGGLLWAPAAPPTPQFCPPDAFRPCPALLLFRDARGRRFPLFGPRCNQILTIELLP